MARMEDYVERRPKFTMLLIAFESFAHPYQGSAWDAAARIHFCLFPLEKHRHRVPNVSRFFVSNSSQTASSIRSITLAAPIPSSSSLAGMRLYHDMVRVDHPMRITYAQSVFLEPISATRPCLRLPDSLIAMN